VTEPTLTLVARVSTENPRAIRVALKEYLPRASMRLLSLVAIAGLLVACRRSIDVRGLYVYGDGAGYFVPCDQPGVMWGVSDTALATRYRLTATTPYQLLFVRLRGVEVDSGGIYGPMGHGGRHLLVRRILEMRARREGECPGIGLL
jgi:hypothetical protein